MKRVFSAIWVLLLICSLIACGESDDGLKDPPALLTDPVSRTSETVGCAHVPVSVVALPPTCTDTGLTEGEKCKECDLVLTEQKVIPAKEHTYKENICVCCGDAKASEGLLFVDKGDYFAVAGPGSCTDTVIVIPQSHNGKPVKEIADEAFYNAYSDSEMLESITRVVIPEGVTKIGKLAFMYCTSLAEVNLPNSLEIVSEKAFGGCFALQKAQLPKSLTEIGASAFANCSKLENIIVPESTVKIGMYAFLGLEFPVFCEADSRAVGWHISWKDSLTVAYWYGEWEMVDGKVTIK